MWCAVGITIWMLLSCTPVYMVAGLYDRREFILHLCAWLFPCITGRINIGSAVELSSIVHMSCFHSTIISASENPKRWNDRCFPLFIDDFHSLSLVGLSLCLLSQSKAFLAKVISE